MQSLSWIVQGLCGASACAGVWFAWRERRNTQTMAARCANERRLREELEAYARLDGLMGRGSDNKNLAKQVCRTIVDKSVFRRVALLLEDAETKLYVAASAGMDDLAVAALGEWGATAIRQDHGLAADGPSHAQAASNIPLTPGAGCNQAIVTMLRGHNGAVMGALAVCADEIAADHPIPLKDALAPLEALATRLGRTVETARLTERLLRAEKLAGLGQLASGVAHELNNPLTAVLGFADLIAETAPEDRIRQDAATISREALRMKEIIDNLTQFWRPEAPFDEPLALAPLLRELAADCKTTLDSRGVKLILHGLDNLPDIAGNRTRLRQVLEHLMNNAAQAIASGQQGRRATDRQRTALPRGADNLDRDPEIRVTLHHDAKTLRLIVSDTGPGFPEAARAFDPFYTTRKPAKSTGLGLSICYGIVREHGGEIAAFNLHPHGAAVVIELPVRRAAAEDTETKLTVRGFGDFLPGAASRKRRRHDLSVPQEM